MNRREGERKSEEEGRIEMEETKEVHAVKEECREKSRKHIESGE